MKKKLMQYVQDTHPILWSSMTFHTDTSEIQSFELHFTFENEKYVAVLNQFEHSNETKYTLDILAEQTLESIVEVNCKTAKQLYEPVSRQHSMIKLISGFYDQQNRTVDVQSVNHINHIDRLKQNYLVSYDQPEILQ